MVTLSLVLLFGILLALMLKFNAVSAGAAIVSLLFGFYLANTPAAATINGLMTAVISALPN